MQWLMMVGKAGNSGWQSRNRSLYAHGLRNTFADLRRKSEPMSHRSSICTILIQAMLDSWPNWALNIENPKPCRALSMSPNRLNSLANDEAL